MIFGGLTIGPQDQTFIQWQPCILYWLFSIGLWASATFWKKNVIQAAMASQLTLKPGVGDDLWKQLNFAWIAFFLVMGVLNLIVAYQFDEATWVNFKLFGGMGLMLAFVIVQGIWLNKFIINERH